MDQAPVRAEQRAVDMNDLTPIFGLGPQLANQAGIIAVGNEADVLAVGLACNAQPQVASNVAHHALLQPAQREAQEIRSEEHPSELPSLMRISYTSCCLKK